MEGESAHAVDVRGHSRDCLVYLQYILMLIGAEYRGNSGEDCESPAADLGDDGGMCRVCMDTVPSLSSPSVLASSFNESCMRRGTSLKRAILRFSCLPLNLTTCLSHYLSSSL